MNKCLTSISLKKNPRKSTLLKLSIVITIIFIFIISFWPANEMNGDKQPEIDNNEPTKSAEALKVDFDRNQLQMQRLKLFKEGGGLNLEKLVENTLVSASSASAQPAHALQQHLKSPSIPDVTSISHTSEDATSYRNNHSAYNTSIARRYAYVFYGTDNIYACSAIVAASHLLDLKAKNSILPSTNLTGNSPSTLPLPDSNEVDIILVHSNEVSSDMLASFKKLHENRTKTIEISLPEQYKNNQDTYYKDCLLKLFVLTLTEYKRIVFMDSDGLPLQNMDHLFTLSVPPEFEMAAPTMYWGSRDDFFSSAFMLLRPREETLSSILAMIKNRTSTFGRSEFQQFDMDALNDYYPREKYGKQFIMLGPEYVCLNSHWETHGLGPFGKLDPPQTIESLFADYCQYLHYTAVGKPWTNPPDTIPGKRPGSHPILKDQFAKWWKGAEDSCPNGFAQGLKL